MRDEIESIVGSDDFSTLQYHKMLQEGSKRKDELTVIDERHHVAIRKGKSVAVPDPIFDPISLMYYVRTLDLTPGKTHEFTIVADGKVYKVAAVVGERETIGTPAGTFKTIVVEPRMESSAGMFKDEQKRLLIWYTDDARHIPVRIRSDLKIGSITVSLRGMSVRLGELLTKAGLISQDQLKEALRVQKETGGKLGETLIKLGFVSEEDITECLSQQFGVPSINLAHFEIDPSVIKLIPADVARKYNILPVNKTGATITIAMADPTNVFAMDDIKFMTGYNVEPVVASELGIKAAIDNYYGTTSSLELKKVMEDLQSSESADLEVLEDEEELDVAALAEGAEEAPVVKLVQPDPHRRDQARRVGHSHRAVREGVPRPLPHRRHAVRDHESAAQAARRDHVAPEDSGEARHLREASSAGRTHQAEDEAQRQEQRARLPRLGAADAVRREDRHAASRQGQPAPRHDQARLRAGVAGQVRRGDLQALGNGACDRAHRLGQDEYALLGAVEGELARSEHHDRRRPGGVQPARASTRCR